MIPTQIFPHYRIRLLLVCSLLLLILLSACATDQANENISTIPVEANPDIIIKSVNANQLSFIGTNQQSITADTHTFAYEKEGNSVTIDLGETVEKPLEIQIPREANLTIHLENGNIAIDTLQGQVSIALISGTISVKNFTPSGINEITTKSGTIDVTFTEQATCNLTAHTNFGAIVSNYTEITEKRDKMKSNAEGIIGKESDINVNLAAESGSITLGPV